MSNMTVVTPDWQVPNHVKALTTTVYGGVSQGDCESLNLGDHVGDNPDHVVENRLRLQRYIGESVQLCWLKQTHSDIVVDVSDYHHVVEGDAAVSNRQNTACVVMTADCLPVLLCNEQGTRVAALHCGWKGLYQDVIGKTLQTHFAGDNVTAWLGPAIGQASYEVDERLYRRFTQLDSRYQSAFSANRVGHYLFDLYHVAKQQLRRHHVLQERIFGGGFDTFTDERFFSYRRCSTAGRIATLIYLT